MRRADRLFSLIQLMRRRRRAVTARWLAEQLEVSERTVYRDIRDLVDNGTPIEGEAGVGYTLRASYDLPPLMFDAEELQALVLGARVVTAFADEELTKAADSALRKIESVVPKRLRPTIEDAALFAPRTSIGKATSDALLVVRTAIRERHKVRFDYERADGEQTSRVVRPIGAFFWGRSWTLSAWCEMRQGFRNFRLDRMSELASTGERFADEPGKTLHDFFAQLEHEGP